MSGQESWPCTAYQAPSTTSMSPGKGGNTYSMKLARNSTAGAYGPVRVTASVSHLVSPSSSMPRC
ncbi:MAG: hypothetical protein QM767_29090 [Anaeromyxobacter sp.]